MSGSRPAITERAVGPAAPPPVSPQGHGVPGAARRHEARRRPACLHVRCCDRRPVRPRCVIAARLPVRRGPNRRNTPTKNSVRTNKSGNAAAEVLAATSPGEIDLRGRPLRSRPVRAGEVR
jgi:hypothetical protein